MQIKIGILTWTVKMTSPDSKKMVDLSRGVSYLGLTEYEKAIIRIRKGMTKEVTRQTIIHELVHAFLFSYGIEADGEEQMCDFFGSHGDAIVDLANKIMTKECAYEVR